MKFRVVGKDEVYYTINDASDAVICSKGCRV